MTARRLSPSSRVQGQSRAEFGRLLQWREAECAGGSPFSFPNSAGEDCLMTAGWIVACVALGIAFNAVGIALAISAAF